MRILIANRGEIAKRVMRTAAAMGHDTIAIYADPDASASWLDGATIRARVGPASLAESYLSPQAILAAAGEHGADAVHPGYGFLSERADFARQVIDAGLIWIGPRPEVIDLMGSKIRARTVAEAAGVPTIPGWSDSQDPEELKAAAARIGFPILVKAAAGGGGKGIRIAQTPADLDAAMREARLEAERSFGDGAVIVERFVERPRHIEVQVLGDKHGTCIDLGTRECSVQRRYQKLVEEAPAPNLPSNIRAALRDAATRLAASVGYDSAGTVEFIVDQDRGDWFFLEMNTRLQVEHPVTEAVTGVDLVEQQILSATNQPLALGPVELCGHSIEVRINAEDPLDDWAPQIGEVSTLVVPDGVRWESGIEAGDEVTPFYDPMLAKLIVSGADRTEVVERLRAALEGLLLSGVRTNGGFHRWLLDQTPFLNSTLTTRWLDSINPADAMADDGQINRAAAIAVRAWQLVRTGDPASTSSPWTSATTSRLVPHVPTLRRTVVSPEGEFTPDPEGTPPEATVSVDEVGRQVSVNLAGRTFWFEVPTRTELWSPTSSAVATTADDVTAPFPAVVAEVLVQVDTQVQAGDPVLVIEAMKMLHTLRSPRDGQVAEVRVQAGATVGSHEVLVRLHPAHETGPA